MFINDILLLDYIYFLFFHFCSSSDFWFTEEKYGKETNDILSPSKVDGRQNEV